MASVTQPLGAASLPGELVSLQNSRYRCTVKIPLQSTENIPSPKMLALGAAYSSIYTVDTDESAYADLKLISQQVGADTVNRSQAILLVQVYETLTATFVAEVDDVTDFDLNGLKRVTRTLIAEAGTSTAAFVVGTQTYSSAPTLYLAKVNIEENDAFVRVRAEYLEPGVVSRTIRLLDGGLREETIQSFYTRVAPTDGIVVYDREENENGYPVWTVTAMQNKTGGDPTSGTAESFSTLESFTYPGRAKLYQYLLTINAVDFTFTDLFLSPPIDAVLDSTVTVSYSTDSTIGTLANTLWNPTEWAVLRSVYMVTETIGGARSKVEGLRGYRIDESVTSPQTVTFISDFNDYAIAFGTFIAANYEGTATLSGGPTNPGGSTWTLKYSVTPAFVDTAGTQYYKRTIVTCAVPSQTALPV